MSLKGLKRAATKRITQKVNKEENKKYYQNGTAQKSERSERERAEHRKISF
jgi:hypothetical protein